MDRVPLAGRQVNRLGITAAGLRTTGMWGEPGGRQAAIGVIRRAVELGAEVLEVAFPFGAAADLVRDAHVPGPLLVVRLTGPGSGRGIDGMVRRLGTPPGLVLADERLLGEVMDWGVPVGAVVEPGGTAPPPEGIAAVRGPYPALDGMVQWCEDRGIPYLAPSVGILAAGRLTVAVPPVRSVAEIERLFADAGSTPPAAGPG